MEKELNQAEALYAFMGWLTSRETVSGPFSSTHDAAQAAELVEKFCKSQGWEVESERFDLLLKPFPVD